MNSDTEAAAAALKLPAAAAAPRYEGHKNGQITPETEEASLSPNDWDSEDFVQ